MQTLPYDINTARAVVITVASFFEKKNAEIKTFKQMSGGLLPQTVKTRCASDDNFTLDCFSKFILYVFKPECFIKNPKGEEAKRQASNLLFMWGVTQPSLYNSLPNYAFASLFANHFEDKTYVRLRDKLIKAISNSADKGTVEFMRVNYCTNDLSFNTKLHVLTVLTDATIEYYPIIQYPSIGAYLYKLGFTKAQVHLLGYSI